MAGLVIEELVRWAVYLLRTLTFTCLLVEDLFWWTLLGAIGTLTLTLDQVKHLVFGACGARFGTVALAGLITEELVSMAV